MCSFSSKKSANAALFVTIQAEAVGSVCFSISDMTLFNEKSRATGLPTELKCYDCNMQREQTLAGAKGLGPCVDPLVLPTV